MDFIKLNEFFYNNCEIDGYYVNNKDGWFVLRFLYLDKDCYIDLPIYDFNTGKINDINKAIDNIINNE